MDQARKAKFIELWQRFFPGAELPIGFYYTKQPNVAPHAPKKEGKHCFIAELGAVRKGEPRQFSEDRIGCAGGKRGLGFSKEVAPDFRYRMSSGIEGQIEGGKYKKTPELIDEFINNAPAHMAPAPYVVFKRWDLFETNEDPAVAIFFATPDVLSGLFTLAGFDEPDLDAVTAPFGAGCASIVAYPYLQKDKPHPRAILGCLGVSSRPSSPPNALSFSVPVNKFDRMIDNMEESFLTTQSWEMVKKRL